MLVTRCNILNQILPSGNFLEGINYGWHSRMQTGPVGSNPLVSAFFGRRKKCVRIGASLCILLWLLLKLQTAFLLIFHNINLPHNATSNSLIPPCLFNWLLQIIQVFFLLFSFPWPTNCQDYIPKSILCSDYKADLDRKCSFTCQKRIEYLPLMRTMRQSGLHCWL